jgi:hypothetical protein
VNILIAGGTGLLGTALTASLLADGQRIWVLTRRDPQSRPGGEGLTWVHWDGFSPRGWMGLVDHMDGVVNLTGESLAEWPWTRGRKQRFWDSRVLAGQALSQAILAASGRPNVFIQISGINHYGPRGPLADESTPPGSDYLAHLTLAWEAATASVEDLGIRRCVLRLGVVLSAQGGLLPLMSLLTRFYLGGRLGSGKQALPWIHLADVVGVLRYLLETKSANGAYNGVAPEQVDNASFTRALSQIVLRPYWLHLPAPVLRLVLGEMAVLVVEGRPVSPTRLSRAGYAFQFPLLEPALRDLLGQPPGIAV